MRIVYLFLASIVLFGLIAVATGLTLSQSTPDRAFHDTYYVVAHYHYALNIVLIFAFFAAVYFCIHRWTSRVVPFWPAAMQCALLLFGITMTVLPQSFLGLRGMPRRYVDYSDSFAVWNWISTLGSWMILASCMLFVAIIIYVIIWGRPKSH